MYVCREWRKVKDINLKSHMYALKTTFKQHSVSLGITKGNLVHWTFYIVKRCTGWVWSLREWMHKKGNSWVVLWIAKSNDDLTTVLRLPLRHKKLKHDFLDNSGCKRSRRDGCVCGTGVHLSNDPLDSCRVADPARQHSTRRRYRFWQYPTHAKSPSL